LPEELRIGVPHTTACDVKTESAPDFDAVIIGTGVSGLYQLNKLRQLGLSVRVFESGSGSGTYYWNPYPGAQFDSESHTYGYSFSLQLLEWSRPVSRRRPEARARAGIRVSEEGGKLIQVLAMKRKASHDSAP
jgi:cation diffusion facilitator CzcD-associated flavoprotein CzcO